MPKIFKAGDYGRKGTYSVDKLKSWVGKEFNITAGHVGDWTKWLPSNSNSYRRNL